VLIVNPFGIGDALFMVPLIRALKQSGAERIDLLIGSRTRAILEPRPDVSHIFKWDKMPPKGLGAHVSKWKALLGMFSEMRRAHYDAFIDLSLSNQYAFLAQSWFQIPIRVGFSVKPRRSLFLTHKIPLPNGYADRPVPDYYLDLLRFLKVRHGDVAADWFFSEGAIKEAGECLDAHKIGTEDPFLCVAPGGGASWGKDARLKHWPPSHFVKLIERIFEHSDGRVKHVLILGGSEDRDVGNQLRALLGNWAAYNLCGTLSIQTSAALIQKAACLIANDGGLVHVASAVGTPLVSLFGPVDPKVYGPFPKRKTSLAVTNTGPACRPCYQKMRYQADCTHIACLRDLSPEHVFEKMLSAGLLQYIEKQVMV